VHLDVPVVSLGALRASAYQATITRKEDGSLSLSMAYDEAGGVTETMQILGPDGKVLLRFPTSTGDMLDFPGWHQRGVTAVGPGPLLQREGQQLLEFVYRPSYEQQRTMRRTISVDVSLATPISNVAAVTRQERPPRTALKLAVAVSAVILGGGVFLAVPRDDDTRGVRNFRFGVGLPLVAVGLAGGAFSLPMLLRPDRDVDIPPERAIGQP
jgi:hypothetical protein